MPEVRRVPPPSWPSMPSPSRPRAGRTDLAAHHHRGVVPRGLRRSEACPCLAGGTYRHAAARGPPGRGPAHRRRDPLPRRQLPRGGPAVAPGPRRGRRQRPAARHVGKLPGLCRADDGGLPQREAARLGGIGTGREAGRPGHACGGARSSASSNWERERQRNGCAWPSAWRTPTAGSPWASGRASSSPRFCAGRSGSRRQRSASPGCTARSVTAGRRASSPSLRCPWRGTRCGVATSPPRRPWRRRA